MQDLTALPPPVFKEDQESVKEAKPVSAATEFDGKAAPVFAYFAIGNDENPSMSLRSGQFEAQIEEILRGGYNVTPLERIVTALQYGKPIKPRSLAITFDGADQSVLAAAMLLEKHKLPYTIFIPSAKIGSPSFMTWEQLRALKAGGLAAFGLHPAYYGHLAGKKEESIRREINASLAAIREELDVRPTLFSYPYGEYDTAYKAIIQSMGFKAAFGQQSGPAHAGEDLYALPRYTQTERYGDLDRFTMTANSLPLPVSGLSPAAPAIDARSPVIGFTLIQSLAKEMKNLSCFSSVEEKPEMEIIGTRVEIRFKDAIERDRMRINCTLPYRADPEKGDIRYRWFGMILTSRASVEEPPAGGQGEIDADFINSE
ncbi:MAG: polysaccharide deacetylase family protein [Micavibrio sp.]